MAVTIKTTEAEPDSYVWVSPYANKTDGYVEGDGHADYRAVWKLIERWCDHRWTPRTVVWVVEGPGEWETPLNPATIDTTELWDGSAWVAANLAGGPLGGLVLTGEGPYRITATVGEAAVEQPDLPPEVREAFRRLHEYMRGLQEAHRDSLAGVAETTTGFVRGWAAKALQLSGAADLLRPWRAMR